MVDPKERPLCRSAMQNISEASKLRSRMQETNPINVAAGEADMETTSSISPRPGPSRELLDSVVVVAQKTSLSSKNEIDKMNTLSNSKTRKRGPVASPDDDDDHHHHDHEEQQQQHPNRRKRTRSIHRMTWEERLQQLKDYKATHGNLLIPIRFKENPSLGKFVHNTREQYKLYQNPQTTSRNGKTKRCSLTADRVRQLEELGFVWSTERSKHQKEDWEARLQQLKEYKAKHGDCLVPHGYPQDPSFAEWVHRQRTTHAHMVKEEEATHRHHHNPLVEDRMKQLEDLGFHFTVHADKWMEHWRELKCYRDIHGHCQVPTHCPQNPKLGRWVHTQRHQRRLQLKGKKSCMTDERVHMLDCLGFSWEVRPHHHHNQDKEEEDEEEEADLSPMDQDGEEHGGLMVGDQFLVSVDSDDFHPVGHPGSEGFHPGGQAGGEGFHPRTHPGHLSVGDSDISSTEMASVPAPDLECTLQAQQEGNDSNQVDYFVRGMTMV